MPVQVLDLSRRGLRVRCLRPPPRTACLLLTFHAPGEPRPIEVLGRARWERVEIRPGRGAVRAAASVGIELLAGAPGSLGRYEALRALLERRRDSRLAGTRGLG